MPKTKVAVTGGIGSGKSTVLHCIKQMGYPVFSCDEIYKELVSTKDYIEIMQKNFPKAVVNGELQRKVLSEIVFNNESEREKLNQITHPLIMAKLHEKMEQAVGELVFAEVPLLFEGNYEKQFDKIIVIMRDTHKRIEGVMQRDGLSEENIKKRIFAQFDYFSPEGQLRLKKTNVIIFENKIELSKLEDSLQKIIGNL